MASEDYFRLQTISKPFPLGSVAYLIWIYKFEPSEISIVPFTLFDMFDLQEIGLFDL